MKLGILISGRGSNFTAIVKAVESNIIQHATIALVVSNNPSAEGLTFAEQQGIPSFVAANSDFDSRDLQEQAIVDQLRDHDCDVVILAGYMRLLGEPLLAAFPKRVVNIHPSLLPAFKGLHAQRQALDYGVAFAGCTVHFVTKDMDAGPIIDQAVVPVYSNDSEADLSERILAEEHRLYPACIERIAKGEVTFDSQVKG